MPAWAPQEYYYYYSEEPNDFSMDGVDVSCAALRRDGFVEDMSCQEGDETTMHSTSALLGPLSRRCAHVLTTHPLLRSGLHL